MKHILSKQLRLVGKKVGEVRDMLLLKIPVEAEIYVAVDMEKRLVMDLDENTEVWDSLLKREDLVRFNVFILGPRGGVHKINTCIKVEGEKLVQVSIELDRYYTLVIPGISK